MTEIKFYIVDVFAAARYQGNQLGVFLDLEDQLSSVQMQQIAREINFAETTFIKEMKEDSKFVVRIFTPEHEVPFAGHPLLGTAYIITKFISPGIGDKLTLVLTHSQIEITIPDSSDLDESIFFMRQSQPEFSDVFTGEDISVGLGINPEHIDLSLPVQDVSTGLPYIIIPLNNLAAMESLELQYESFKSFLLKHNRYRTNSLSGHSTSLFFFTKEAYETGNHYNARMMLIENNKLSEDAATGSANGCLLAYLLKYENNEIKVTVEQGFQMGRKSHLYLAGALTDGIYQIHVGGRNKLVSEGTWYVQK